MRTINTHFFFFFFFVFLGDNMLQLLADRTSGKKKIGRGRRTANPDSIFMDASSYRVVSKSWALSSFRLLARHLANAENCQSLSYVEWSNFVKRNSYGKFLSRGACKDVFCVQNIKGSLEAVSGVLNLSLSFFVNVISTILMW